MSRSALRRLVVGSLAILGGCGQGTPGQLGRAQFQWSDGFSCLLGCPLEGNVVAGGHTDVLVRNFDSLPPFTVRSSDPLAFVYTRSTGGLVDALAIVAGSADLELIGADGAVIDRVTLHARRAASINARFDDGLPPGATNLALASSEVPVFLTYADAAGASLRGNDAYAESTSGAVTIDAGYVPSPDLVGAIAAIFGPPPDTTAVLTGASPGSGALMISSGDATLAISFSVVAASDVATIQVVRSGAPNTLVVGDSTTVTATASTAAAQTVHGMLCDAWSTSTSGVVRLSPGGSAARQSVLAAGMGQTDVTCALGATRGSVHFVVTQ